MFQDSRRSRTRNTVNLQTQINTLKSNETADDSSRSTINTLANNNRTSVQLLEQDAVHTQTYTALFNDFFMTDQDIATFQFATPIATGKMITVLDFQIIIYDPEASGATPTYNAASSGHTVVLTRNSATLAGNSTTFTNNLGGGPLSRCCQVTAGTSAGPIYFGGSHGDFEDHRRASDHLNHRHNNDSDNLDTHLKICVQKQAGIAKSTTEAGLRTKVKLIVRYRLMNYPTLT